MVDRAFPLADDNRAGFKFISGDQATIPEGVSPATDVYDAQAVHRGFPHQQAQYSLAAGVGDNDLFSINPATGAVTFKASPDYEHPADAGHDNSYDIVVTARFGHHKITHAVEIRVTDVAPTAPIDGNPAADSVAEGAPAGTPVGITAVSSDVGAVTYSIAHDSSGGGFQVDPKTGVVAVADPSRIDYESAPGHVYAVTVAASDGTLSTAQTFSIAVTDIAPSVPVDANAAANTVGEHAAAGTTVGITASSTDVNGPAVTYSVTSDTSNGGFAVNSSTGVVTVADGTKIDYATAPNHAYSITVAASDGTETSSSTFTVAVTGAPPSTPTDSDASPNTVLAHAAAGTPVGITAASTDPDGGTVTYSLTNDAGHIFQIDSQSGVVSVLDPANLDKGNYTITAVASDPSGETSPSQTFTIAAQDNPPVAVNDSYNVTAEHTLTVNANNGVLANDTDADNDPLTATVVSGPSNGTLALAKDGSFTYTPNAGFHGTDSFTYTAYDGTANSQPATVNIAVADNPPVVTTSGHPLDYTEHQGAAPIDPQVTVSDVDGTQLTGATAQITGNYVEGQDVLSVPNQSATADADGYYQLLDHPNISAKFDAATGTLTLKGLDTHSDYDAVLQSVTYDNTSNDPSLAQRTVTFTATDEDNVSSAGATDTINVTPVPNHAPSGANNTVTTLEDTPYTFAASDFGFSDPNDKPPNMLAAVKIDTLPAAGALTDNGHAVTAGQSVSVADINGGLLTFTPATNANGNNYASFTFQVQDNGGTAYGGQDTAVNPNTLSVDVTSVNNAPQGKAFEIGVAEGNDGGSTIFTMIPSDFGFSDPNDAAGASGANNFKAVIIDTLSGLGQLFDGNRITASDTVVPIADVEAGQLRYLAPNNAYGYFEPFSFSVQDDGGTANGGVDTSGPYVPKFHARMPDKWTGTSGSWSDGSNWSEGHAPSDEPASVPSGTAPEVASSSTPVVVDDVDVNNGGMITIDSGATFLLEDGTTIAGGTLTIGAGAGVLDVEQGGGASIRYGATAYGATLDGVIVTNGNTIAVGASATLTLDDDTTIVGGTLTVAANGGLLDVEKGGGMGVSGAELDEVTVTNSGTIQVEAGATLTLNGATLDSTAGSLGNAGTIQIQGSSKLELASSVTGTGTIVIASGATLDVTAQENQTIVFAAAAGTLRIDQPSAFTADISAASGNVLQTEDVFDFTSLDYRTTFATTGPGSYNTSTNTTTLTVVDVANFETHTFKLVGDYSGSQFTVTNDGHGGADIADPPAASTSAVAGAAIDLSASHASVAADPIHAGSTLSPSHQKSPFGASHFMSAVTPLPSAGLVDVSAAHDGILDVSAIVAALPANGVPPHALFEAVENAAGTAAVLEVNEGTPAAPHWVAIAHLDGLHSGDGVALSWDAAHPTDVAHIQVEAHALAGHLR